VAEADAMTSSTWLQEKVIPLLDANRRVLLVEGEEDQKVYEAWLDHLAGGKGSGRVPNVVPAGNKYKVLQHIKALQVEAQAGKIHGLVDRDEWDEEELASRLAETPGLRVNEQRHCLESYFCDPAELKAVLARSSLPDGARAAKALEKAVKNGLTDWVRHWALWTILERLKNRMSDAAYPNAFHQGLVAPADKTVKTKLQEWAGLIHVDQVLADYRALRKDSLRRTQQEQLCSCIYAKNVFPQVVLVELNKLETDIESDEWMPQLASWFLDVPDDVREILQPLVV
jgi:hypothetical protein